MSLKHKLIRLIYPHGSVRTVRRGPISGVHFVVSPGMGATYAWGVDAMNQSFLVEKVKPGSVVYDVGANRGQMALYFSRLVGPTGKVFSFEPAPDNFALLEKNLGLNPSAANVKPFKLALAADNQPRQFCYDTQGHTMGTFADKIAKLEKWTNQFEVQCDTLDHLLSTGLPKPDLIKIDVEGAGAEVLKGAEQTLRTHRPMIYMEVHASSTAAPEWEALQRLKTDFGYLINDINGTFGENRGPLWGAAAWCDPV
jgi:FkbM family methyltransferase